MGRTTKCAWAYPVKNERDWFDQFVTLLGSIDEAAYTAREQRSVVIMTEATFSFAAGVLSWDQPVVILCPTTGYFWTVDAGSQVVSNGQMIYASLPSGLQGGVTVTFDSDVPSFNNDAYWVFAYRYDSAGQRLFFRNGRCLNAGESAQLFSANGDMLKSTYDTNNDGKVDAAAAADTASVANEAKAIKDGAYTASAEQLEYSRKKNWDSMVLHLAVDKVVTQAVPALSCCPFHWYNGYWGYGFWGAADPAYIFTAVAWVSGPTPGKTVKVELYNLTNGELVTGTDITTGSGTPVILKSPVISVGAGVGQLRNVETLYEVRVTLIGAADPADFGNLGSSSLRFIHSIP